MPIGNFPMLQGFMQRQRKPGQQGQQMPGQPAPPPAYGVEQQVVLPDQNPNMAGQLRQQQFNQQQQDANRGMVGGSMNRRRY
jgi:hypothetical protein